LLVVILSLEQTKKFHISGLNLSSEKSHLIPVADIVLSTIPTAVDVGN